MTRGKTNISQDKNYPARKLERNMINRGYILETPLVKNNIYAS